MESENKTKYELSPRDIFGPIATLSGLLVASIGLIHTTNLSSSITQTLIDIILLILLVFITTAFSASFYLQSGRMKWWTFTLTLYPISWISFGIGIGLMLTIVAYGQSFLAILHITPVILLSVLIIGISILFVILTYMVRKRYYDKEIRKINKIVLSDKINMGDESKIDISKNNRQKLVMEREMDLDMQREAVRMTFLNQIIELESILRRIAHEVSPNVKTERKSLMELVAILNSSNKYDRDFSPAIKFLVSIRNNVVHGIFVPYSTLKEALEIAIKVSHDLELEMDRLIHLSENKNQNDKP
jgi:hypothetical protein